MDCSRNRRTGIFCHFLGREHEKGQLQNSGVVSVLVDAALLQVGWPILTHLF